MGGVRQINKDIKTTVLKSLRAQTDFCRFCLGTSGHDAAPVPLRRSTEERSEAAGPNCWVLSPPFVGGVAAERRPDSGVLIAALFDRPQGGREKCVSAPACGAGGLMMGQECARH